MYHHSKIITMFAVFTPRTIVLVYKGTTFLCPNGSIMSQNIRLSNPTLGHRFFMNCMLVLGGTGRRQPSLYIYISNSFQLCQEQMRFAMQGIIVLVQQRPPTKRVLLLSPLPAIHTLTLPFMASTCTDAPSATCAVPINPATPLPDASTSPGVKRLREPPATKPLSSSWWRRIVNIFAMWQNAISASVSAIMLHGCLAIRNSRSTIVTSHSCSHLHKSANYYFIAQPTFLVGCAGILHPKN